MARGTTISSKAFCDLLENRIKLAVGSKRFGLLSSGEFLTVWRLAATQLHVEYLSKLRICMRSVFCI